MASTCWQDCSLSQCVLARPMPTSLMLLLSSCRCVLYSAKLHLTDKIFKKTKKSHVSLSFCSFVRCVRLLPNLKMNWQSSYCRQKMPNCKTEIATTRRVDDCQKCWNWHIWPFEMPVGNLGIAHKMLCCDWSVRSTCTQTLHETNAWLVLPPTHLSETFLLSPFFLFACLSVSDVVLETKVFVSRRLWDKK